MTKNKTAKNLIVLAFTMIVFASIGSIKAYADSDCEDVYGGGQICEYDRRFKITKEVRIAGESSWKDKVTDVKENEIVEFRITVKNKSDDEADKADDLETKDILPDEMEKVGGAGLTEEWDNFEPGATKTFIITAIVKNDEYDRDYKFEKCVVNKVELRWDGDFEGSDTATVCYGNIEPAELPKTGAVDTLALVGLGLLTAGLITKKKLGK
jgi:hypothetical protein